MSVPNGDLSGQQIGEKHAILRMNQKNGCFVIFPPHPRNLGFQRVWHSLALFFPFWFKMVHFAYCFPLLNPCNHQNGQFAVNDSPKMLSVKTPKYSSPRNCGGQKPCTVASTWPRNGQIGIQEKNHNRTIGKIDLFEPIIAETSN